MSVPDEGYSTNTSCALNYLVFQSFDSECTRWWLFWAYLMIVILSVPDDGYFERIWWWLFWAYLMMVILSVPDDGYFERTWWRLFWAYLMMVIPETRRAHFTWYLRFYCSKQNIEYLRWVKYPMSLFL